MKKQRKRRPNKHNSLSNSSKSVHTDIDEALPPWALPSGSQPGSSLASSSSLKVTTLGLGLPSSSSTSSINFPPSSTLSLPSTCSAFINFPAPSNLSLATSNSCSGGLDLPDLRNLQLSSPNNEGNSTGLLSGFTPTFSLSFLAAGSKETPSKVADWNKGELPELKANMIGILPKASASPVVAIRAASSPVIPPAQRISPPTRRRTPSTKPIATTPMYVADQPEFVVQQVTRSDFLFRTKLYKLRNDVEPRRFAIINYAKKCWNQTP